MSVGRFFNLWNLKASCSSCFKISFNVFFCSNKISQGCLLFLAFTRLSCTEICPMWARELETKPHFVSWPSVVRGNRNRVASVYSSILSFLGLLTNCVFKCTVYFCSRATVSGHSLRNDLHCIRCGAKPRSLIASSNWSHYSSSPYQHGATVPTAV